jgi:DNA-binding response OmpR family regulator
MGQTKPEFSGSVTGGAGGASTGGSVRPVVLLLEDDVASAEALTQLLVHYEWDVRLAKTLLEAMPLLPMVPAVAILDLMMPDGGGDRVLDLIRRRKLSTKVVILTGCRERERLQETARLKPDLILTKPVDFFRLLDFMRAAVTGT